MKHSLSKAHRRPVHCLKATISTSVHSGIFVLFGQIFAMGFFVFALSFFGRLEQQILRVDFAGKLYRQTCVANFVSRLYP